MRLWRQVADAKYPDRFNPCAGVFRLKHRSAARPTASAHFN